MHNKNFYNIIITAETNLKKKSNYLDRNHKLTIIFNKLICLKATKFNLAIMQQIDNLPVDVEPNEHFEEILKTQTNILDYTLVRQFSLSIKYDESGSNIQCTSFRNFLGNSKDSISLASYIPFEIGFIDNFKSVILILPLCQILIYICLIRFLKCSKTAVLVKMYLPDYKVTFP